MEYENLDLLILGDAGVGKSTLIQCYLTQRFDSRIGRGVLQSNIQIPGTEFGCKQVNINIIDTTHEWPPATSKLICQSSCVMIIASFDNTQSLNRVENVRNFIHFDSFILDFPQLSQTF